MGGETKVRAKWFPRLSTAALMLWALGCGGGLIRSPGPDAGEVDELKRQVVELERQARVYEVEMARLEEEIAELETELSAAREAAAREAARTAEVEAAAPPPEDDAGLGPIRLSQGIEETELEESEAPPRSAEPPPPAAAPPEPPPPAPASPEALRLYDDGYTLFHQKRYDEAEERFRRFLALHGETELADNAQFWIGECRYARDDFAAALEAFTSTVERYPQGNKVADALLKAGKCLERLDRREEARQTYLEITDRFPTSAAAAAARERLESLR